MKIETNAQAVQALENYLPTDDLIDFVKYLEKEFDLDLE